jgi:superfamily I DNA/RNA helicase
VLYDETDLARPFSTFMERVVGRWRERLKRDRTLTRAETSAIVDKLRGDFDLRPSLRAQVSYVVDELVALTKEQSQALEGLVDNPRAIIRGGAGTGKTLLALEEARRWTSDGRKVLLTCFNRNLAAYLQAAARDDTLLTVEHLHGFMARIVAENGLTHRLPDVDATDLFEVFYPELALEALLGEASDAYDVAIVDEGQDLLREAYLDILDASLRGGLRTGSWRMFLDPRQNVYDAIQAQQLARLSSSRPAEYRLGVNCRNTIPIAVTTALLAQQDLVETLRVEGPDVETHWYADEAEQSSLVARHVNRLLAGGIRADDVAILSPRRAAKSGALARRHSIQVPIVDLTDHPEALSASGVKFSTISGFKGLEADAVLLVDNEVLGSSDVCTGFYVGASRARALLAVFLRSDQRENYAALGRGLGEREAQTR